jgi:hypothetical protein
MIRMRPAESWSSLPKQDYADSNIFLLGLVQGIPPLFEFFSEFNLPSHLINIPSMEYSVNGILQ